MRRCTATQRDRDLTWILVCTNAREGEYACCADVGGDAVVEAATQWLRERDLFWTEAAVVEMSCLGLCSEEGAAVGLQPRDEWYADVRPDDVPELLAACLGSRAE